MESLTSILKIFLSACLSFVRFVMSFRAKGVEFCPSISSNHDGTYNVEAWLSPGNDEVFFDTFIAKECDVALGFGSEIKSPFYQDRIPIRVVVNSKKQSASEFSVNFVIRPRTQNDAVRLTIKGGWLNQLSTIRHLPGKNYTIS